MNAARNALLVAALFAILIVGYQIAHEDRFEQPSRFSTGDQSAPDATLLRGQTTGPVSEQFTLCDGSVRVNCVVDGDTFWFRGEKIRIADIDTPEIVSPRCAQERHLGEVARDRLLILLNLGPFNIQSDGRNTDRYGRKLRIVSRSGKSIGEQLVEEGVARRWNSPRRNWCE
jgi:micrococcal nuclease